MNECNEPDCNRPRYSLGLCRRHYDRQRLGRHYEDRAFECDECGKSVVAGEDGVGFRATRFCSRKCKRRNLKRAEHARNKRRGIKPWQRQRGPVETFVNRTRARSTSVTNWKKIVRIDPCPYCGERFAGGADHVEPRARGGADSPDNIVGVCNRCNATKQTLPMLDALRFVPMANEYHKLRSSLF